MSRNYSNWLKTFIEYASIGEAPVQFYFWTGVSAIAGALRRRVWMDMVHFKWYPNFYIIFVAPPGIVSKTTTASIGMSLLRQVPGIKFGPDVITWQALTQTMAAASESFQLGELFIPMSAITIESSEFGNLFNPQDREMVDLFVSLWDGKDGAFTKVTKTQGEDIVKNPWINIIACTTPGWIAGSFPEYLIGGGFTSRCIFVFGEEKQRLIAYPDRHVPEAFQEKKEKLIQDLEHISLLAGPYILSPEARAWGEEWYAHHHTHRPPHLDNERFGGYIARKQTHIHKLAMIIAAAQRDTLYIELEDLKAANTMVSSLEADMIKVFAHIGRSEASRHFEEMRALVEVNGKIKYVDLVRAMLRVVPRPEDFEALFAGLVKAHYVQVQTEDGVPYVVYLKQNKAL